MLYISFWNFRILMIYIFFILIFTRDPKIIYLISKYISRYNDVYFFDILISKSGPEWRVLDIWISKYFFRTKII